MQASKNINQLPFKWIFYAGFAAFITYCSMYAFRKPFAAATFSGYTFLGMDYKILLIIIQAIGYTASKFIGIRFVTELKPEKRIQTLLALILISWIALFLFAMVPAPYNIIFFLANGLPLGLIWGIVFSFLEGRRYTEILGAMMASSFIFASGIVKSAGRMLIEQLKITEFWMPFFAGLLFIPLLLVGIFMLQKIPARTDEDEQYRTKRLPMNREDRNRFFRTFAPGIILSILIYVGLTIIRDLRDNFAVELWTDLGFTNIPALLSLTEVPIGLSVLLIIGLMMLIKNNSIAFFTNQMIIFSGGILLLTCTLLFMQHLISPITWIILMGFSMYLPYISFHVMFYERWIALFKYKSNIGYLMYISDAFGYLGSTVVLCCKGAGFTTNNWTNFFCNAGIAIGILIVVSSLVSSCYFYQKQKKLYLNNLPFD